MTYIPVDNRLHTTTFSVVNSCLRDKIAVTAFYIGALYMTLDTQICWREHL